MWIQNIYTSSNLVLYIYNRFRAIFFDQLLANVSPMIAQYTYALILIILFETEDMDTLQKKGASSLKNWRKLTQCWAVKPTANYFLYPCKTSNKTSISRNFDPSNFQRCKIVDTHLWTLIQNNLRRHLPQTIVDQENYCQ